MTISPELPLEQRQEPEITARSIPQVFMSPEVRASIEEGETSRLTEVKIPGGILVTFKNGESKPD